VHALCASRIILSGYQVACERKEKDLVMSDSDASTLENRSALDSLFSPKSVAVIGATEREGTVGRTVLENLLSGPLRGKAYAVNPNRTEVLGLRSYAKIGDIPEKVNLVVLVTPAQTVAHIVGECVDAGVGAAIVISAGFKERGAEGAALELRIQEQIWVLSGLCSLSRKNLADVRPRSHFGVTRVTATIWPTCQTEIDRKGVCYANHSCIIDPEHNEIFSNNEGPCFSRAESNCHRIRADSQARRWRSGHPHHADDDLRHRHTHSEG
jgi:predicted CoA-binding protein